MKAEHSRMISRQHRENQVLLTILRR